MTPPRWNETSERLERVEQAVETIAIEIERVSEGRRYISRLLSERGVPEGAAANGTASAANGAHPLPALGAGSPKAILGQQQREEVRVRRS